MSAVAPATRVFISHSHNDNLFARKLVRALSDAGLSVWYDEVNLGAGNLGQIIEQELLRSDAYIVIFTPSSVASQFVRSEWYAAWDLQREGRMRLFVPIVAEACDVPLLLRGITRVDFTKQPFEQALKQVLWLLGASGPANDILASTQAAGGGAHTPARPLPTVWEQSRVIQAHSTGCYCLSWSRDGRWLASGSYDRRVIVWDAATGTAAHTLLGHTKGVDAVAWAPDSVTLASASLGSQIRIWDTSVGKQTGLLQGHADGVRDVSWSPNGQFLASASLDQTLRIWDVARARCVAQLQGHEAALTSVDWSPDGRWLASTARDATVRIWDAATGRLVRTLTGHHLVAHCVRWSPDGALLASSGNTTVRMWRADTGAELTVFNGSQGHVLRVAWSPDQQLIASGSADHMVRLWSVRHGRAIANLGGHSDWVHGVAWSPNGDTLATCGGAQDGTIRLWRSASV
ncbi:MAG TPA: TIR domain-containing protein [Ktedonobacterales bacterium]